MAIDTAAKRRGTATVSTYSTLPAPTGAITVGDRAQVCWVYRGLTFADVVVAVTQAARRVFRRPGRPGLWL